MTFSSPVTVAYSFEKSDIPLEAGLQFAQIGRRVARIQSQDHANWSLSRANGPLCMHSLRSSQEVENFRCEWKRWRN